MTPSTQARLESELAEIFRNTPTGLPGNAQLAIPKKPKAFNAITHGLTAQHLILPADEVARYARMGLEFMRECRPVGVRETGNAQLMFEGRWRLHRILSIEGDLLIVPRPRDGDPVARVRNQNAARQVNAFREEARNIELISRYETRIVRNGARLNAELKELQKDRAAHSIDADFDEPNNEAIAWYTRLTVASEALAVATQEYEEYAAAQRAAAGENSVKDDDVKAEAEHAHSGAPPSAAANANETPPSTAPRTPDRTSEGDSFRKMRPSRTAEAVPPPAPRAQQWRPFTPESLWGPDKIAA